MQSNATPQHGPRKPAIGLLGAPGSGKSTVAKVFAELGCAVIDADRLSHDAINSEAVRDQLRQWWGDAVLDPTGQVNRAEVGRIVFSDKHELHRLEQVLHPMVHAARAVERERHQADPAVVAIIEDTPLLLESGMGETCDVLVFIDCPLSVRLERVAATRGWDAEELKRREDQQAPLDDKRSAADAVINNDVDLGEVREQAERILRKALS